MINNQLTTRDKIEKVSSYFTDEYLRVFKRLKPLTRKTYFTYISEYLMKYGDDFSEKNVEAYLMALPKSSRNKAFYALKHFAHYNNLAFPVNLNKELPEDFWYSFYDRQVERFTKPELQLFAKACITGKLNPKEAAAVALAMIYGVRRAELKAMKPKEDLKPAERRILIRTAKKGRKREHYVPVEILPFVWYLYTNRVTYSDNFFSDSRFYRICKKAGVTYIPRRAWHAFRRSLVTDLLDLGLPDVKVYDFMRWQRKEVIFKYYLPNPELIDREIFSVHPYLPYFRKQMPVKLRL